MFCFATQPKTKYILKTFRDEESLQDQKQSCISRKAGLEKCRPFFILFVLMDAILLCLTRLKGQYTILFFSLLTNFLWASNFQIQIAPKMSQYIKKYL